MYFTSDFKRQYELRLNVWEKFWRQYVKPVVLGNPNSGLMQDTYVVRDNLYGYNYAQLISCLNSLALDVIEERERQKAERTKQLELSRFSFDTRTEIQIYRRKIDELLRSIPNIEEQSKRSKIRTFYEKIKSLF